MCEVKAEMTFLVSIEQIIVEFQDIVLKYVPHWFSSIQDIQHASGDCITGVDILNIPAYVMCPQEHAEITRQVEESLKKLLILESVSSSIVLEF